MSGFGAVRNSRSEVAVFLAAMTLQFYVCEMIRDTQRR
jgi:hypothetical protein